MGYENLKSNDVKKGLRKVTTLAKECSTLLEKVEDYKGAEENLRKLFTDNLQAEEYFFLVDRTGTSVVHTNRLREGIQFTDEVGVKAAKTDKPLAQYYQRDTGEVLIDCSAPVIVKGQHKYSLRLGINLIQKRLLPRILLTAITPFILGVVFYAIFPKVQEALMVWAILGVIFGLAMGYWLYLDITKALQIILKGSKAVASGDLTQLSKPKTNDELGRIAYEFNKVSLGLKSIIIDLQESTRQVATASLEQVQSTNEVSQAAEHISTTVEKVVNGAHEQNENMQEATRITTQMAETMNQMTENSLVAVKLAEDTLQAAEKGTTAVEHSIKQMLEIRQSVDVSAKVIKDLEEKSIQIGQIINTITNIADQTNLLALNAAIEAARAGEQGRGFAVVAEEVRKLAEMSSASAQEIMSIISETQAKTTEAVKAMAEGAKQVDLGTEVINETGQVISEIMSVVKQSTEQIHANSTLAASISVGSSSIVKDLEKNREISEEAANIIVDVSSSIEEQIAMSEEIAASSHALSVTAESLQRIIEKFKVK